MNWKLWRGYIMKSNNQKEFVNDTKKRKHSYSTQSCKLNKKNKKMANVERGEYDNMNQIDWFPVDPYCD